MKKPKLEDFKREVYDGQDYADWYKEYYQALEKYVDELEQALRTSDVVGRSEELVCVHPYSEVYQSETECYCEKCGKDLTAAS